MGTSADIANLLKVYWSLFLGNIVEWYEFAIYGYLEPYLEEHFFRGSAIGAWMGFGVTFLARPLGGIAFGVASDMFGRRMAINLSIMGMLVGTCGQGLLPTYSSGSDIAGSVGLVVLILLRFLQGLCAAGEISTISTYITEVGAKRSLGRSISLIAITCNIGFLSAKGTVFAVETAFGQEALQTWSWRLPFIFALVPGLAAVWGRRSVPESQEYLDQKARDEKDAREAAAGSAQPDEDPDQTVAPAPTGSKGTKIMAQLAGHRRNIVIGMCGVASMAMLQYGGFVWIQSYLEKRGLDASGRMLADLCSRGVMIVLSMPVGWLMDTKGVAWVTFVGSCLLAACGLPLLAVLDAYPTDTLTVVLALGVGYGLVGSMVCTSVFFYVVELFPTSVRGAAVGISYNIGLSVFGGLAPIVAQASLQMSPLGPGWMLSFGGLITATSVLISLRLQRGGIVKLTHVREAPYFNTNILCGGISDDQKQKAHDCEGSTDEGGTSADITGSSSE